MRRLTSRVMAHSEVLVDDDDACRTVSTDRINSQKRRGATTSTRSVASSWLAVAPAIDCRSADPESTTTTIPTNRNEAWILDHGSLHAVITAYGTHCTRAGLRCTTEGEYRCRWTKRVLALPTVPRSCRVDDRVDGDGRGTTWSAGRCKHADATRTNHHRTTGDRSVDDEVQRSTSSTTTADTVASSDVAATARAATAAHLDVHARRSGCRSVDAVCCENLAKWSCGTCESGACRASHTCRAC